MYEDVVVCPIAACECHRLLLFLLWGSTTTTKSQSLTWICTMHWHLRTFTALWSRAASDGSGDDRLRRGRATCADNALARALLLSACQPWRRSYLRPRYRPRRVFAGRQITRWHDESCWVGQVTSHAHLRHWLVWSAHSLANLIVCASECRCYILVHRRHTKSCTSSTSTLNHAQAPPLRQIIHKLHLYAKKCTSSNCALNHAQAPTAR